MRATAVTAVAMPVSLIPTFAFMALVGFSLDLVSLLALTLVIGILCSLFTGFFCTRIVFDWWVRGAKVKRLSGGAEF